MTDPHTYAISGSWRALAKDLGADPERLLKRAELQADLFTLPSARIGSAAFYRLWDALEAEVPDRLLPVVLCDALRGDTFSPELFAALCSPNLLVALQRICQYKPLIAPLKLVLHDADPVTLDIEWLDAQVARPPLSYVAFELMFFVALARLGTREPLRPTSVTTEVLPTPVAAYERWLGARVQRAERHRVSFARADALRPFLTSNPAIWNTFEPDLRRRLAELDAKASMPERVRAALLESLPSGQVSMEAVAKKLGLGKRTLQRRLTTDGTTYQDVLKTTHEALARHYLEKTALPPAEISFLLGFEEPNSFYRAFSDWTGQTPERVRRAVQ